MTQNKIVAADAQAQLVGLALRMTIALLRHAINDADADALALWQVAAKACETLKDLPQSVSVSTALRWCGRAMEYDEDAWLSRWCLEQALEALTC